VTPLNSSSIASSQSLKSVTMWRYRQSDILLMNVSFPSPLPDQIVSVQQFDVSAQKVTDSSNLAFSHPLAA
jgi:hypothetical protein